MRRLNEEEIQALSLEMKVCYMLQGWNNVINPKTPEEWAEQVGFFNFKKQGEPNNNPVAINKALHFANYHIDFIKKYIEKEHDHEK